MSPLFYYGRDGAQYGPFSATQLRTLAAAGDILITDSVWQQGAQQKAVASRVGNLFPASAAHAAATEAPPVEAPAPLEEMDAPNEALGDYLAGEREERAPPPPPRAKETRKKRVIGIKGGTLLSQDGFIVQFKKKCGVCGGEDACRSTATIRVGTTRVTFFCRKCRKARSVELQGIY